MWTLFLTKSYICTLVLESLCMIRNALRVVKNYIYLPQERELKLRDDALTENSWKCKVICTLWKTLTLRICILISGSGKPLCAMVTILYSVKGTSISRISEVKLEQLPLFAKYISIYQNNYIQVVLLLCSFLFSYLHATFILYCLKSS